MGDMLSAYACMADEWISYSLIWDEFSDVARFLFELTDGAGLCSLIRIHQASRNFYDGRINGRTPLLLQQNSRLIIGFRWVLEDGCNAYAVDIRSWWSGETFSGFPCALNTFWVSVGDSRNCQQSVVSCMMQRSGEAPV